MLSYIYVDDGVREELLNLHHGRRERIAVRECTVSPCFILFSILVDTHCRLGVGNRCDFSRFS